MCGNWREKEITEPQKEAIKKIHSRTDKLFIGKTRGEASEFIGAHKAAVAESNARNFDQDADDNYWAAMEDTFMWGDS